MSPRSNLPRTVLSCCPPQVLEYGSLPCNSVASENSRGQVNARSSSSERNSTTACAHPSHSDVMPYGHTEASTTEVARLLKSLQSLWPDRWSVWRRLPICTAPSPRRG